MNQLSVSKQSLVLSLLVEGSYIRTIERVTGVTKKAITKLLVRAGEHAQELMDKKMQRLQCKTIQIHEIWSFVAMKQKEAKKRGLNDAKIGDQYVFVAVDADTKLVPTWKIGKRNTEVTRSFIEDLSERCVSRIQLSSDAFPAYKEVVDEVYGNGIDYGQIHKIYAEETKGEKRYSPAKVIRIDVKQITGEPNPNLISTSYVERQNLTMRMSMRRFTRLTNAFSKKLENLEAAVALHYFHYNFMRIHETIRVTPAMEAKVADHIWSWEEFLGFGGVTARRAA